MENLLSIQPIRKQYAYFFNFGWPAVKFLYFGRSDVFTSASRYIKCYANFVKLYFSGHAANILSIIYDNLQIARGTFQLLTSDGTVATATVRASCKLRFDHCIYTAPAQQQLFLGVET